jgi:hypothetical protein
MDIIMIETPSSEEITKLLKDLGAPEVDTRIQAVNKLGLLNTSTIEIVSELIRLRETDGHIVVVDLCRKALEVTAHQTVLQQNRNLEKTIVSQLDQQYRAEKAEIQKAEKNAHNLKYIWIETEVPIAWPPGCANCGNPGEMVADASIIVVPLRWLKTETEDSIIPFFIKNKITWEQQVIKPPICQTCVNAMTAYETASGIVHDADSWGFWVAFIGFFLGLAPIIMFVDPNGLFWVVPTVIWLGITILLGVGVSRWIQKKNGNPPLPPRPTNGYECILYPSDGEAKKIGFNFSNPGYKESFKKANQLNLTPPPNPIIDVWDL